MSFIDIRYAFILFSSNFLFFDSVVYKSIWETEIPKSVCVCVCVWAGGGRSDSIKSVSNKV